MNSNYLIGNDKPPLTYSLLSRGLFFLMQDIICKQCGVVNDFRIVEGTHHTAYCNSCGNYIKHLPKPTDNPVIYFGKYKGTKLKDFTTKEHVGWLQWALRSVELKPFLKEQIEKHLGL